MLGNLGNKNVEKIYSGIKTAHRKVEDEQIVKWCAFIIKNQKYRNKHRLHRARWLGYVGRQNIDMSKPCMEERKRGRRRKKWLKQWKENLERNSKGRDGVILLSSCLQTSILTFLCRYYLILFFLISPFPFLYIFAQIVFQYNKTFAHSIYYVYTSPDIWIIASSGRTNCRV